MEDYKGLTKAKLAEKLKETDDKLHRYIGDYNVLLDDYKILEDKYIELNVPEEVAVSKLTEEIDTLNFKIKRMASQNEELDEALTKSTSLLSFRTQEINETKKIKRKNC